MNEKKSKTTNKNTAKAAWIATIPVMAGYLVLGAAFGILLADKGYSFLWAVFMSLTIYAGSMQFVAVNLLSGGAALISAALMSLLVNARHLVYGVSMLQKYRNMGKAKPYLMFALTDETYALLCQELPQGTDRKKYYLLVSFFNQIYWVAGSAAGGLLGSALTVNTAGIDFAMTALFVTIFTEQWLTSKEHIPALIGVGISVLCLLVWGSESFLIPSMVFIVALLSVRELVRGKRQQKMAATVQEPEKADGGQPTQATADSSEGVGGKTGNE